MVFFVSSFNWEVPLAISFAPKAYCAQGLMLGNHYVVAAFVQLP